MLLLPLELRLAKKTPRRGADGALGLLCAFAFAASPLLRRLHFTRSAHLHSSSHSRRMARGNLDKVRPTHPLLPQSQVMDHKRQDAQHDAISLDAVDGAIVWTLHQKVCVKIARIDRAAAMWYTCGHPSHFEL